MKSIPAEAKGLRAEILELKKDVATMQAALEKVERLEKSIGYHELVLVKKVKDINEINEKLPGFMTQESLKQIKKGLLKVERHEDMLFESARYIKEVIRELEKVRQSHLGHFETIEAHKKDNDERFEALSAQLSSTEEANAAKKREVHNKIIHIERDLLDRLSQVEYQNKLIMKYLKRIDEKIFK